MKRIKLFTTAFFQVFFVVANTYFIANSYWVGIAFAGFTISYLWTMNVKKIAIATFVDRLIYSSGAMIGGLLGLVISKLILKL